MAGSVLPKNEPILLLDKPTLPDSKVERTPEEVKIEEVRVEEETMEHGEIVSVPGFTFKATAPINDVWVTRLKAPVSAKRKRSSVYCNADANPDRCITQLVHQFPSSVVYIKRGI